MRAQVIFASLLMLFVPLAGCIDGISEDVVEEITEIWGCMDTSALNYDITATNSSDLCLLEEQLLLAEEVFWSSWDSDAINNATGPVGYRLMISETSADENESRSLDIQEVFSSDYYDQKILLRHGDGRPIWDLGCRNAASSLGIIDEIKEDGSVEFDECHYSSQTVFDNLVQVEKYSDGEWDNYSMDTASTYDEFRNRLEHGPGIRDDSGDKYEAVEETETVARSGDGEPGDCNDSKTNVRPCGFPSVADAEFESIDFHEVELRGSGRTQTIYYFAKDTNTGTEIEVMGEMTEDGFKITEYCNEIIDTNETIIYNFIDPEEMDGSSESVEKISNDKVVRKKPGIISTRIILLEIDGDKMHFEEYDYAVPIEYGLMHMKAIPFYFEGIYDEDTNESENKSATEETPKGLNAVNVKLGIAAPSGPYGIEGDLSDYRLVTSNCTLDNKTIGLDETSEADNMTRNDETSETDNMTRNDETSEADNTTKADEEDTSARSEGTNGSINRPGKDYEYYIYGSAGNSCTDIDAYDLSDIDELLEKGITFVDADSSGTLSEGDRFEFSENYTCDDCAEANMLRLYSISADGFSDENINPSSEMSSMHQGAMNAIRNIRAVVPDDPAPPVRAVDHNSARSNRDG